MADTTLGVELVPDQDALENIEEKQLEISGEPGAVDEATDLNEEQNEQLSVIGRSVGRIATRLGLLTVIAGAVVGISKVLGEILDISFQDVRNAIVSSINLLIDSISNLFSGGGRTGQPSQLPPGLSGIVQGTGAINPAFPQILTEALQIQRNREQNGQGDQDSPFLFTSREMLTGDSTQQEMQSQNSEDFIINGGS